MKFDKNVIAGILALIALIIELGGLTLLFINSPLVSSVIELGISITFLDIVVIVAFIYTIYKTLIKNEKLTKWEWLAFILLFGLFTFWFFVGLTL